MPVLKEEFTYPSYVGDADIHAVAWKPEGEVKAVMQLIHGMAEHIQRYDGFARFFAEKGIAVYGNDHLGHGLSVNDTYPLGYFGTKNEAGAVWVEDVKKLTDIAKKENPGVPFIAFGHSMGSFVNRAYLAKYSEGVDAAVICGTAGPNPAVGVAIGLSAMLSKNGGKKSGDFMGKITQGTYNNKTDKRTPFDWLSINEENVDVYIADPLSGFQFSNQGYHDLTTLLKWMSSQEAADAVKADLPILIIAGSMDPVGAYGKGPQQTYEAFKKNHEDVTLKLYDGYRHEIHNDNEKELVMQDVYDFIAEKVL